MKAGNRTLLQSAGGNPLPAKEELPRGFDIAPFISLRPTSWSFHGRDLYYRTARHFEHVVADQTTGFPVANQWRFQTPALVARVT